MRPTPAAVVLSLCLTVPLGAALTPGPAIPDAGSVPIVADIDANGLDDLIYYNHALLNHGGGQFVRHELELAAGDFAREWLDFNGDGRPDLLGAARSHNGMLPSSYRVYINEGNGRFRLGPTLPTQTGGGAIWIPFIAEVNGDDRDDVVLLRAIANGGHQIATELKVLLSNGGTFEELESFTTRAFFPQQRGYRLLTGDVDGNNIRDIVLRGGDLLIVLRGTGGGVFRAESHYLPSQPEFGGSAPVLDDIDGDGRLDLVLNNVRKVIVLFGDGRGSFARFTTVTLSRVRQFPVPPVGTGIRSLITGEFVERGRTEIAAGTPEGDVVFLAYAAGSLHEVGRAATEFMVPDVHQGRFLERDQTDLLVTWNNGYPADRPSPRVFLTNPRENALPLVAPPVVRGRARAVRSGAPADMTLALSFSPECMAMPDIREVTYHGMFGEARTQSELFESVLLDGALMFRLYGPWSAYPMYGLLMKTETGYDGKASVITSCGPKLIAVSARRH